MCENRLRHVSSMHEHQLDSGGCCFKVRWGGTKGLPPQHFIYKSQCCPPSSVQVWWPSAQIQK